MLVEPEQVSILPKYREESVVEHENITGVLNHCFRNIRPTEEYYLHQCQKRTKGVFSTVPYFVPTRFLSCLAESGAELSFGKDDCSLEIRYGKNKEKTSSHHIYGVFKGNYGEEEVSGLALGGRVKPCFDNPPDISDPNEFNEMKKIFEEISECVPIKDIEYWEKLVSSNND
jgi:hypothetical protein